MASFGANTPMLPCAKDDNARVSVWGEHVGKELAHQPRDYGRQFRILQPEKMEVFCAKAGMQAPVERTRTMRRTLVAASSETEQLRAKLAKMYEKNHGVDIGMEPRGPRRVKPGGEPVTLSHPPRAQSLPERPTAGAFGVHGAEQERPGDPPPADSLDEFRGAFMSQLQKGTAAPRERGVRKPQSSSGAYGWEAHRQISQPALERLTERSRLISCDETKYGSNYIGTWGRGLYQAKQ